ncbi:hypothetical protein OIU76_026556 [Salix suchowensis]|nr:hypothetical protein OIU76_026556 [Salix suchowensis]
MRLQIFINAKLTWVCVISLTRVVITLGQMALSGVKLTGSWSIPFGLPFTNQPHVHFGNQGAFSDHSFATALINPQDKGRHSFKFLNMWSSHVDFSSTAF